MKSQVLLKQEIDDLIEEFNYIETPIDKMQFIIEFGTESKNDDSIVDNSNYLVEGCVSRAFLKVEFDEDETLKLSYYADAVIIQGFFAIICDLLENTLRDELNENLNLIKEFSAKVGLQSFLSPNRSNALFNIFKKIEEFNNDNINSN